ncbi:MAG: hypothetical protein OES24_07455 [Acidimicrobiia bacterium]|nr:hypothetical protein [Acidimicrobiia bacterium]
MLETADRTEASTQDITLDTMDPPSSGSDAPPSGATWPTRLGRVLVGCLVAEAAVGAIALAVLAGALTAPEPPPGSSLDRAAVPPPVLDTADGSETFLIAWRRSLDHDHTTTGTLTRRVLDRDTLFTSAWPDPTGDADRAGGTEDPAATVWLYRHSRLGGRTLTQIGDVATVVDPVEGRRTCLRQDARFICAADNGPPTSGAADQPMAAVEQAVVGPTATHRIVAIDPADVLADFPLIPIDIRCWEARSLTDGVDQRWGRRAQFCFHDPSGAAVFRRILGTTRVEILTVDSVSETVSPADLDPV